MTGAERYLEQRLEEAEYQAAYDAAMRKIKTCIFCDEIFYHGQKVDSLGLCACDKEEE
jgi:hypothetical protein